MGKFPGENKMAQPERSTVDKWDPIKMKSFCNANDTFNKKKTAT